MYRVHACVHLRTVCALHACMCVLCAHVIACTPVCTCVCVCARVCCVRVRSLYRSMCACIWCTCVHLCVCVHVCTRVLSSQPVCSIGQGFRRNCDIHQVHKKEARKMLTGASVSVATGNLVYSPQQFDYNCFGFLRSKSCF